jgi:tetratricopeptide (TPR) repeat protein
MGRTTMTTRRTLVVVCVVALAAAVTSPVAAQPLQEAKAAFQEGQAAYDRGAYNGAVAQWQRSFELSQKVSLFYNIGLAYERMGKLEDAVAALERFVGGTQANDAYLDRGRARLALIRERIAQTGVVVACNEEGATILIDDRDVGRTPRPDRIALTPGSHRVIVRKDGFSDFRSDVALAAGEEITLEVALSLESTGPTLDEAALLEGPQEAPAGSTSVLGPVLTIGGGVVAATGIVVGVVALGKAKDATSEGDADSARTLALVADVSMAVGLAAAAVGAYIWFIADGEPNPAAQSVGIAPRGDGAFVSTLVRF